MTVTFNAWTDFDTYPTPVINYYKAATGVTVNRGASNTTFDFFDDDFGVGDYLLFSARTNTGDPNFMCLKINVGTAIAAASYTGVWQYNRIGVWTDMPASAGLVDGTNGFSTTGLNTVTYHTKTLVRPTPQIRFLITAVSSPTEGGANTTNKVQVGNQTIEINSGDTATPASLYTADVAGGWGCIVKPDTNTTCYSYTCYYNIKIKSGGTFNVKKCVFEFYRVSNVGQYLTIEAGGTMNMGTLHADGYTYEGASILIDAGPGEHSNPKLYVTIAGTFNGYFSSFVPGSGSPSYVWAVGGTSTYKEFLLSHSGYHLNLTRHTPDGRNLFLDACARYLPNAGSTADVTWTGINVGRAGEFAQTGGKVSSIYFVDCSLRMNAAWNVSGSGHDCWRNGFIYGITGCAYAGANNQFRRQISFDLKVTDQSQAALSGATVVLSDAYGTQVFSTTTAADGSITQQWVTVWALHAGSSQASPTYTYTPWVLTISMAGYEPLVVPIEKPAELDNPATQIKYLGMKLLCAIKPAVSHGAFV